LKRVEVVAALIGEPGRPGRYLAQQRLPGGSRGLLWEFPGGKIEPGESEPEALVRECREELAVEIQVGRLLWRGAHAYPDLHVSLALYLAKLTSGVPRPVLAHALSYLTPSEMSALPFCEADLPLLEELRTGAWGLLD